MHRATQGMEITDGGVWCSIVSYSAFVIVLSVVKR